MLLLLVIGTWDRPSIGRFKRTSMFSQLDYDLLTKQVSQHSRLLTTPCILTEVSDLVPAAAHALLAGAMAAVYAPMEERWSTKERTIGHSAFPRLGYADAMIVSLAGDDVVVMTDDLQLYLELLYRGHQAINFNHLRRYGHTE